MKVIYVAGPYSAPDEYGVKLNIAKAEALAVEVWKSGKACAICPHLNTAHWTNLLSHEAYLKGDLEMLNRCDAVLLCPDWRTSKGAVMEYNFACQKGIFVFYELKTLLEWLESTTMPNWPDPLSRPMAGVNTEPSKEAAA